MITVIYSDHLLFSQHYPTSLQDTVPWQCLTLPLDVYTPNSVMQINMNKIIKE